MGGTVPRAPACARRAARCAHPTAAGRSRGCSGSSRPRREDSRDDGTLRGKSLTPGPLSAPPLLRSAGWEAERKRRPAGGGRHRPLTPPVTAWKGHKEQSQRRAPPPVETWGFAGKVFGEKTSWNGFATELPPKAAAPGGAVSSCTSLPALPGSRGSIQRGKGSVGTTAIPVHPGSRRGFVPRSLGSRGGRAFPEQTAHPCAQPGFPDSAGKPGPNRNNSHS